MVEVEEEGVVVAEEDLEGVVISEAVEDSVVLIAIQSLKASRSAPALTKTEPISRTSTVPLTQTK